MFSLALEREEKGERERKHWCERETMVAWIRGLNPQPFGVQDNTPNE